jgi:hypothetical protein
MSAENAEGERMARMWLCDDGNAPIECYGETAQEAAEEYVDGGDWGESDSTWWCSVWCEPVGGGEAERVKVRVDPPEPECPGGLHDWDSPYELLGGLRENPGVWGHGGGVMIREVCRNCGWYRVTDTWAQDRCDGEQGLESVSYRLPCEDSLLWAENCR